ncbi:cupin domain-containing protein [Phormidium sp. CCY1219]|nr:cupin domain-containing protein [Phormidium sp. CCY1219]
MKAFSRLLYPYSLKQFFSENWSQEGLLIKAESPDKLSHLFSWDKLNELLNFHNISHPELRFSKHGEILSPSDDRDSLIQRCQEGATLIIDRLHTRLPEIAQFAAALRYEIGHRTQVNSYCSWPGEQGFKCHYDTHEVFILQIAGQKEWLVFRDTFKYPLSVHPSSDLSPPTTDPYLHCILNPGDVLYIPRGHWHYAIAVDEPSLHLTLGIDCQTGVDFVDWLVTQLQEKEEWRQNLSPIAPQDSTQMTAQIDGLIHRLIDYLLDPSLSTQYANYLASLEKPPIPYSFPYQMGYDIFRDKLNTQFKRPPFQRVRIESLENDEYNIFVGNKSIALKGLPREFLDWLFAKETFTLKQVISRLPQFDLQADILPLISRLVTEGIICVDKGDRAGLLKGQ